MTKRQEQDREGIGAALERFSRRPPPGKAYVPPSRKNRKSITTWQDETALKELRDLSHERGRSQQELIAEALNLLFAKHGKRTVAT
jgi:hypothetical protein